MKTILIMAAAFGVGWFLFSQRRSISQKKLDQHLADQDALTSLGQSVTNALISVMPAFAQRGKLPATGQVLTETSPQLSNDWSMDIGPTLFGDPKEKILTY